MPIEFTVNNEDGYFECRYIGDVTDAEHIHAWKSFHASGDWQPGTLQFLNLSALGTAMVTPSGIQIAADFCVSKQRQAGIKQRHLILAPTTLSYGISRMFLTYCDVVPQDAKFVTTINQAQKYLQDLKSADESKNSVSGS